MIKRRGGKKTPEGLDKFFKRGVISEDTYKDFWPRWWKASEHEQSEIIDQLTLDLKGDDVVEPKKKRKTTRSKESYRAAALKGWRTRRRNILFGKKRRKK